MAGERRLGQDRAAGSKARTAMPQIVSPDPPAVSFEQDRIEIDDALAAKLRQGDAAFRLARRPSGKSLSKRDLRHGRSGRRAPGGGDRQVGKRWGGDNEGQSEERRV